MRIAAILTLLTLAVSAGPGGALAHSQKSEHTEPAFTTYGEQLAFGRVGKASEVARTVEVDMKDTYRFAPHRLTVRAGETLRLVFRNTGAQLHEWVLGTTAKIEEHAALMKRFPNMEHDEPHQVHVPPGETRELVWQFNRPGTFEFACLLPGHFDAGMKGTVEVR